MFGFEVILKKLHFGTKANSRCHCDFVELNLMLTYKANQLYSLFKDIEIKHELGLFLN
jgi:hypothetical protein